MKPTLSSSKKLSTKMLTAPGQCVRVGETETQNMTLQRVWELRAIFNNGDEFSENELEEMLAALEEQAEKSFQ